MAKPKFQSPTGTHDILPQNQAYYDKIYKTVKDIVSFYDFGKTILRHSPNSKGVHAFRELAREIILKQ
jgi:cellulose biosynthesis protein BcsQ